MGVASPELGVFLLAAPSQQAALPLPFSSEQPKQAPPPPIAPLDWRR